MIKRKSLVSAANFLYVQHREPEEMMVTEDTLNALTVLNEKVKEAGGTLKLNSVSRTWKKQKELRSKYEAYQKLSEEEKKKTDFVPLAAFPGHSFHEAGRAIDISLASLNFKDIPHDQWLKKFWDISAPLGWTPIIDKPDMDKSEAWHFDFMNEWDPVYRKLGYGVAAQCAILDIGNWDPDTANSYKTMYMFTQAQLLRLGKYGIGPVDGIIGLKSSQALESLGLRGGAEYIAKAIAEM